MNKITVAECASILGISPPKLRRAIKKEIVPFGVCLPARCEEEKDTFIIPRTRFEAWLEGKDLRKDEENETV